MTSNLRQQLQVIRDEHGSLTPQLVVDTARNPEHPLHGRFEWDDGIAAERWRLEQAGQLLRVTYRPIAGKPNELRAFVAIKGRDTHKAEYVPTAEALGDEFSRKLVLRDMEREWKSFKRRYEHMAEFADLIMRDLGDKAG